MKYAGVDKDFFSFRSPAAKRRRQEEAEDENSWKFKHLTSSTESIQRTTTPQTTENSHIEVPRKTYQVYNILAKEGGVNKNSSTIGSQGSILVAMYNSSNGKRGTNIGAQNAEESVEMRDALMQPQVIYSNMPVTRRVAMADYSVSQAQKNEATGQSINTKHRSIAEETTSGFSTPSFDINPSNISQSYLERTYKIEQARRLGDSSFNFNEDSSLFSSE